MKIRLFGFGTVTSTPCRKSPVDFASGVSVPSSSPTLKETDPSSIAPTLNAECVCSR